MINKLKDWADDKGFFQRKYTLTELAMKISLKYGCSYSSVYEKLENLMNEYGEVNE